MQKGGKQEMNNTNNIKVVAKNRPTKKQADLKLKQLGEFLSNNWQNKDNDPLD